DEDNTNSKNVSAKRAAEASHHHIGIDFNIHVDAHASTMGWMGKCMKDLPRQAFTKEELIRNWGMKEYAWDRLYIIFGFRKPILYLISDTE
ncbi:hypothetical protein H0H92_012066, partial [Tricholoma furcatifolium]